MLEDRYYVQQLTEQIFLIRQRKSVEEEPGPVCEPHRGDGPLLALRRPGVDLPVPGVVSVVRQA